MGADARARFRIEGEDGTEAAFRSATKGAENAARKMRAEFDRATGGMISSVDRLRSQSAAVFAFIGGASIGTAVRALASARMEAERVSGALTVAAGSAEQAARQFQYVTGFSDQMGLSASETALAYARFAVSARGTALEGAKARDVFEAVAGASTALSLSADDTAGVLLALSQMISKGKVQAEELRGQLGERLPGAFQLAARAMGVTTSELDDMLKKGEVMAEDLLPKLATEIDKTFGDQAVRAASGFTAEVNRLANAWERLKRAAGNSDSAKSLVGIQTAATNATAALIERPSLLSLLSPLRLAQVSRETYTPPPLASGTIDRSPPIALPTLDELGVPDVSKLDLYAAGSERATREAKLREEARKKTLENLLPEISTDAIRARALTKPPMEAFYAELDEATKTSAEKARDAFDKTRTALDVLLTDGRVNLDDYTARLSEAQKEYAENLEQAAGVAKNATANLSDYAKRAAENMQDAFAEFLFDPFKGGLRGMVVAFATTLRQMVAQVAAARIFDGVASGAGGWLGSLLGAFLPGGGSTTSAAAASSGAAAASSSWLTGNWAGQSPQLMFGGGRAAGGGVEPGRYYRVNENTPNSELFIPGVSGSIVPGMRGGGITYAPIINIDSRSDRQAVMADVQRVLQSNNRELMTQLTRYNPGIRT